MEGIWGVKRRSKQIQHPTRQCSRIADRTSNIQQGIHYRDDWYSQDAAQSCLSACAATRAVLQLMPWPRTENDVRKEIAAYYAVIDDMDAQIGRILTTLKASGRYDNTVILFTSDHGLALGSHGLMGKQNMYEHTIGVPFIIAGPGIPSNRRTEAKIYLRDMFPTTCELAGIPIPKSVEAKSLVPILQGTESEIYPAIFGYYKDDQRMIRTSRWKLIQYPLIGKRQLFDLENDPDERADLSTVPKHHQVMVDLQNRLDEWFQARGPK